MLPIVASLEPDDVDAVTHYYESIRQINPP
jgi:hypothetical protein